MTDPHVELIDHTGDAGLRVRASSLPLLLTTCAVQMVRLCCPDGEIEARTTRAITIEGHDLVELLVGWLAEINTLMALHFELYGTFRIDSVSMMGDPPYRLAGTVQGEPIDPDRHHIAQEIKAVTFGDAHLREEKDGWHCQVIFDL